VSRAQLGEVLSQDLRLGYASQLALLLVDALDESVLVELQITDQGILKQILGNSGRSPGF
jgi:hypothetical protein